MAAYLKKPDWLRVQYNREAVEEVARLMKDLKLNTVCKEANCPNLGECYKKHTATFMVMGSACTRNCRFCNVSCAKPQPLDPDEPRHLAEVAKKLALRHVVVTQVTRDDLPDGGAAHMAAVVRAVHETCPGTTVEVLISDLKGSEDALRVVLDAKPEVLNHNVEMVSRLYHDVRPQARYERSLKVLSDSKKFAPNILTKTGFMLGLGETDDEVYALMDDIRATGCDILTISQYLQPSPQHWALQRYVTPEEFARFKDIAMEKGFKFVASSPLVRSSYRAAEAFEAAEGRV
ncbi:MAG: lipoyl synthase [Clostridiales bacterium]|nr:lipoyl synthase [Clostridiales bacterium]